MINTKTLGGILVFALSTGAMAGQITLVNWDIETNSSAKFGKIDGWGPNGGWADHASFAKAGNETLGVNFGFYSAGNTETVGQLTSEVIAPNMIYKFWSYGQGGSDNTGLVPYQIGYAATDGVLASFVALKTNVVTLGASWVETEGVTYTTGATGAEIGKQLIVRLGQGSDGGATDVWFDSFKATSQSVVPEPITVIGLGLGVAFLARRKRK
jgi:hypothetical protein